MWVCVGLCGQCGSAWLGVAVRVPDRSVWRRRGSVFVCVDQCGLAVKCASLHGSSRILPNMQNIPHTWMTDTFQCATHIVRVNQEPICLRQNT